MSQAIEQIFSRQNNNVVVIATDGNFFLLQIKMPPAGYLAKLLVQQATGS